MDFDHVLAAYGYAWSDHENPSRAEPQIKGHVTLHSTLMVRTPGPIPNSCESTNVGIKR